MENDEANRLIANLDRAFKDTTRPEPLTEFIGSYNHEQVRSFNNTDWENATYSSFMDGYEGWIICPAETKVYLTPKLLRILVLRLNGKAQEAAVDNLDHQFLFDLERPEVFSLLTYPQMKAIIDAVAYVDRVFWFLSDNDASSNLIRRWGFRAS